MFSETCTAIGGSRFGNTCRISTPHSPLPASRADSTKPASRRTFASARATRM